MSIRAASDGFWFFWLITLLSGPAFANDPPVIVNDPDSLTGGHCETRFYDFDASDTEGDSIWCEILYGPGSIDPATGLFSFESSMDYVGLRVPVAIRACDTAGCGDTIIVDILTSNEAPLFVSACDTTVFADAGIAMTYYLAAADADTCDAIGYFIKDVSPLPSGVNFIDQGAGALIFVPDILDVGQQFEFQIGATDSRDSTLCPVRVAVGTGGAPFIRIDTVGQLSWGDSFEVSIHVENTTFEIGGFDFMIGYDTAVVAVDNVAPGQLLADCGWEFFSHYFSTNPNCIACPSGLLQITAIADILNGSTHPSCFGPPDAGTYELARITLHVRNDWNILAGNYPLRFTWESCSRNLLSSVTGGYALVDLAVYDWNGSLLWDESDNDGYPEYLRPPTVGTPDSCFSANIVRLPIYQSGRIGIDVPPCCGLFTGGRTGNVDCDELGRINLADVTRLVDRIYISQTRLCCEKEGNVNGDPSGNISLSDVTRLIDHVYVSGVETAACQ